MRFLATHSLGVELEPGNPLYYISRATAYIKDKQYTASLQDFDAASNKDGYRATADILINVARCRFLLGSPSSAMLAVRDALSLDPVDGPALVLRRRILDLEGHLDAYKGAVARGHWRMAQSAYEACLSAYAQEGSDAPTHVRCWGVELLVVDGSWEVARKTVE